MMHNHELSRQEERDPWRQYDRYLHSKEYEDQYLKTIEDHKNLPNKSTGNYFQDYLNLVGKGNFKQR